jgi:hypothetical protein
MSIIKGAFFGGSVEEATKSHYANPKVMMPQLVGKPMWIDYHKIVGKITHVWFDSDDGWWHLRAEVGRLPKHYTGLTIWSSSLLQEDGSPLEVEMLGVSLVQQPTDRYAVVSSRRHNIS